MSSGGFWQGEEGQVQTRGKERCHSGCTSRVTRTKSTRSTTEPARCLLLKPPSLKERPGGKDAKKGGTGGQSLVAKSRDRNDWYGW